MTTLNKKNLLSIVIVCFLAGCTSTTQLTLPEDYAKATSNLAAGDEIRIATRDGAMHQVTVEALSDSGICGSEACYDYPDIESITVESISMFKTTAAVVGTFLALTAAAAASVGSVF